MNTLHYVKRIPDDLILISNFIAKQTHWTSSTKDDVFVNHNAPDRSFGVVGSWSGRGQF